MIPGATSGDIVLHVEDVSIVRDGTRVLDHVSFDVVDRIREGRITARWCRSSDRRASERRRSSACWQASSALHAAR